MRNRTTFVIAHRFSTLRNAHRVIVLDQGRMVGFGSHEQLVATCGTYRKLWASQTAPVEGSSRVGTSRTAEVMLATQGMGNDAV